MRLLIFYFFIFFPPAGFSSGPAVGGKSGTLRIWILALAGLTPGSPMAFYGSVCSAAIHFMWEALPWLSVWSVSKTRAAGTGRRQGQGNSAGPPCVLMLFMGRRARSSGSSKATVEAGRTPDLLVKGPVCLHVLRSSDEYTQTVQSGGAVVLSFYRFLACARIGFLSMFGLRWDQILWAFSSQYWDRWLLRWFQ